MKCPKCGYLSRPGDHALTPATECPACGVIYSKYDSNGLSEAEALPDRPGAIKKPSPVDEASLRTARERVEMRLRKRAGLRISEDRREQTLQLAKQLAAEGVRQRREDWKRRQPAIDDESDRAERNDWDENIEMPGLPGQAGLNGRAVPGGQAQDDDGYPAAARNEGQDASPSAALDPVVAPADAEWPAQSAAEETPDQNAQPQVAYEPGRPDAAPLLQKEPPQDAGPAPHHPFSAAPMTCEARTRPGNIAGRDFGRLFLAAAWVILLVGIIGAALSWTTLGNSSTGMTAAPSAAGGGVPIALLLGFAYLSTGVLGFAFFWVVSMINRQLSDIQRLLLETQEWTLNR